MRDEKYYVALFKSKSHAIQIIYVLENLGYKNNFQLISTPCEIQAGCGFSIKFNDIRYLEILKEEAASLHLNIEKFYYIERNSGKKVLKNLNHLI